MKQVVQNLKNGNTEIIEVPTPQIRARCILVRTAASLVSAGTERNLVEFAEKSLVGKARSRPDLMKQVVEKARREGVLTTLESAFNRLDQPLALGYSSSGTVIQVGEGVTDFKPGDRVVCAGGGHAVHAEFALVPENLTAHLPDNVEFESGAFSTLGAIALNGVRLASPQVSEKIAVIGLGLLGLVTAHVAAAAGCEVFGMDISSARVKFANSLGLAAETNRNALGQYQAFTRGRGFDHVLICADTPSDETVELAGVIARDRGHVVSLGVVGLNLPRKLYYEKELYFQVSRSTGPGRYDLDYEEKGADYPLGYVRWTEGRNLEAFVDLLAKGSIDVKPLITHRIPIENANLAYNLITGKTKAAYLGVLLTYNEKVSLTEKTVLLAAGTNKQPAKSKAIRLGVLGAGNYAGAVFLPVIRKAGEVSLIGIASPGGASAQNLGRKFGFQFAASDEKELISHKEINTIAVLSRHDSHARLTLQALKAGKHVYCEKPLALKTEDLKLIEKELAKKSHPYLMVGFNRRFAPFAQALNAFFDIRTEPLSMYYRVNAGFLPLSHWLHDPLAGGGRLVGEGCHFIDFLCFLTGQAPDKVKVACLPDNGKYHQDNLNITLEFPDGSVGTIAYLANGSRNFGKEYAEIFCGGKVGILNDFRTLELVDDSQKKSFRSRLRQDKGHQSAWSAFTNAIRNSTEEPIPYDTILKVSYATLACQKSLQTGEAVILSEFMRSG
ncbi:MAG: bi-domain-containing oxidoreductase [Pelolinea sp.]|nr:bi-domain-containing oxidoreductase [Pelolinea sp.]